MMLTFTVLLAGCGSGAKDPRTTSSSVGPGTSESRAANPGGPTTSVTPAASTQMPTPPSGAPSSGALRRGHVVAKSDVSGLPDTPATAGRVLIVPAERAAEVAADGGFDSGDLDGMRHATFDVSPESLAQLDGVAPQISDKGDFDVEVAAGRYLVCLADVFPDHGPGPPYSAIGCDLVELATGAGLTVSFGEAGVEAASS